jgi:hypothetical protein
MQLGRRVPCSAAASHCSANCSHMLRCRGSSVCSAAYALSCANQSKMLVMFIWTSLQRTLRRVRHRPLFWLCKWIKLAAQRKRLAADTKFIEPCLPSPGGRNGASIAACRRRPALLGARWTILHSSKRRRCGSGKAGRCVGTQRTHVRDHFAVGLGAGCNPALNRLSPLCFGRA